jgi:tRNA nucleotidyltransferase/poly(A) polymerase
MSKLDPHKQRDFAVEVVRQLRGHGFQAYWAGGCVRDHLLGRMPKDYDVATSAQPAEIRGVFPHRKTLALGAAFGVMTVLGPRSAGQIEVATFRQDVSYSDGRHPDRVQFSSPEEDARRRDFTINGMFYDPLQEQIIDFVGGQADLQQGVIRAIGDARQRFTEDKLRMLRAVRFAATFNFRLDPSTLAAIGEMASQITVVSAERIADEMRNMMAHATRATAVQLLSTSHLLAAVLPEAAAFVDTPPWLHRIEPALRSLGDASFPLTMAMLLLLTYQQDETVGTTVGNRWRLSKAEIERINWLLENRNAFIGATEKAWSELQPLLSADGAKELIALHACLPGIDQDIQYCLKQCQRTPAEMNPEPLVTGNDLIEMGIPPGPIFSSLLQLTRNAQLDGEVTNRAAALAFVRKWWQIGPPL